MSLSSQAIDGLFAKLAVRYGSAWFAKWDGVPMEAVKADWLEELGGLGIASITHGLMHLPDAIPPTASQFKWLCLSKPDASLPKLPGPRDPIPPAVAARIRPLLEEAQARKRRDAALASGPVEGRAGGGFTPIPDELLPPGGLRAEP